MSPRSSRDGFALVEALVAVLVLGIVLGAVLPLAGRAADTGRRLEDRLYARLVALNVLADLRTAAEPPRPGRRSGVEDQAGRHWPWTARIAALPGQPLARITVEVWAEGGAAPLVAIDGFAKGS